MKWLAGAAKPRSWKRTKLTTAGGLGAWSPAGGTIHFAGRPSSFAASWPAETSSLRASRVTVDRPQAYGSRIVRGGGGAIRKDQRSGNGKQEDEEEL
jgi:hypothetical protein